MAPDFKAYLATQVIAEKQTVSYRNVSRALKVHVNAAKCMLFEFYEKENSKKSGTVYATYLISGTKTNTQQHSSGKTRSDGDDEAIPSSPPPFTSSMLEPSQQNGASEKATTEPRRTITLAREETLDNVKNSYETITSIHMYSISPGRLPDIVVLTDIGRELFVDSLKSDDTSGENKVFGVIQNPYVTKRKGKRPVFSNAPSSKFQPVKSINAQPTTEVQQTSKPDSKGTTDAKKADPRPSSREQKPSPQPTKPTLKKDNSNLFKAFAKQSEKPKLVRHDTENSTVTSESGVEDVKMTDADEEGDSEYEALFPEPKTTEQTTKKRGGDRKKEREDKSAKLRKMMDSDDDEEIKPEPNVNDVTEKVQASAPTTKAEDGDGVEWSESDKEKNDKEEPPAGPRRRRGKRKVMKRRTMKDEEGYLVTKEEAVWESFSEDEPEPAKEKPKTNFNTKTSSQKSTASAKPETKKKGGGIMNFFGKK